MVKSTKHKGAGRQVDHASEAHAHPNAHRRAQIPGSRKGSSDPPGHMAKPTPDKNPDSAAVANARALVSKALADAKFLARNYGGRK